MQIQSLALETADPAAMAAFYRETLGFPAVEATDDVATIQAGATRLLFHRNEIPPPPCHYAFTIPENRLVDARAWLAPRVPLAVDNAGESVYAFENWDADALYFRDPAGNIAELIARHTLRNPTYHRFTPADIVCVSEIGIVVDDVLAEVARLGRDYALSPYQGQSATFAAVGDHQGLFILVPRGRIWFSDTGVPAAPVPIEIRFDGRTASFGRGPGAGRRI